jgi:hypothetical protein
MSEEVVTKYPTQTQKIVSGWYYPTRAYVEDGSCTYADADGAEQKYYDWGWTTDDIPEGSEITKVEMGCKHKETDSETDYYYTVMEYANKGYSVSCPRLSSLGWYWYDITSWDDPWDLTKLNNFDFRIICETTPKDSGGCFPDGEKEITFFALKDEKDRWLVKRASELQAGDRLWVWTREGFKTEPIVEVKIKEGKFDVYEFWSGKVQLKPNIEWYAHYTITGDQPIAIFEKQTENLFAGPMFFKARDVYDMISHGREFWIGHLWGPKPHIKMFPITKAVKKRFTGKVYIPVIADKSARFFVKTLTAEELETLEALGFSIEKQQRLGPPFLAIIGKWTSYVDVVAVRVTFIPPGGQTYDIYVNALATARSLVAKQTVFNLSKTAMVSSQGLQSQQAQFNINKNASTSNIAALLTETVYRIVKNALATASTPRSIGLGLSKNAISTVQTQLSKQAAFNINKNAVATGQALLSIGLDMALQCLTSVLATIQTQTQFKIEKEAQTQASTPIDIQLVFNVLKTAVSIGLSIPNITQVLGITKDALAQTLTILDSTTVYNVAKQAVLDTLSSLNTETAFGVGLDASVISEVIAQVIKEWFEGLRGSLSLLEQRQQIEVEEWG